MKVHHKLFILLIFLMMINGSFAQQEEEIEEEIDIELCTGIDKTDIVFEDVVDIDCSRLTTLEIAQLKNDTTIYFFSDENPEPYVCIEQFYNVLRQEIQYPS